MKPLVRQMGEAVLLTVVTVGVAYVIQKPDVRRTLVMYTAHTVKRFCDVQARFWGDAAIIMAQTYQRARL